MGSIKHSSRLAAGLLALALCAGLPALTVSTAQAEQYQSRLGSLLLNKASFYLPGRLVLGQDNRFTIKARPGSQVRVFISPQSEGYLFADRLPLQVGTEVEELTGTIPESGVLELTLPLPNEASWDGQVLYVDAVVGQAPDFSDYVRPELVDATGRRTTHNLLVLTKPAEKNGMTILPAVPGMDPQVFNQVTTLSEIYTSQDARRKQLLMDGNINRDAQIDQNSLINRGMFGGAPR